MQDSSTYENLSSYAQDYIETLVRSVDQRPDEAQAITSGATKYGIKTVVNENRLSLTQTELDGWVAGLYEYLRTGTMSIRAAKDGLKPMYVTQILQASINYLDEI